MGQGRGGDFCPVHHRILSRPRISEPEPCSRPRWTCYGLVGSARGRPQRSGIFASVPWMAPSLSGAGLPGCRTRGLIERLTTIGRRPLDRRDACRSSHLAADVLPVDDFGVRDGYRLLHGLEALPRPRELAAIGEAWARSAASPRGTLGVPPDEGKRAKDPDQPFCSAPARRDFRAHARSLPLPPDRIRGNSCVRAGAASVGSPRDVPSPERVLALVKRNRFGRQHMKRTGTTIAAHRIAGTGAAWRRTRRDGTCRAPRRR